MAGKIEETIDSVKVAVDALRTSGITVSKVELKYAAADLGGTAPTNAQMIAAFGAVATAGAGFAGIFKDADGNKLYICGCDGVKYYQKELTAGA